MENQENKKPLTKEKQDQLDYNNGYKMVEVKDNTNIYKFKIVLFSADKGLKFYTNLLNNGEKLTPEVIKNLLEQAILLNDNPQLNQQFSYDKAITMFRNPFAIIKLATQIKEFQDLFITNC